MSTQNTGTQEKVIRYQTHEEQFRREFWKARALVPLFGLGIIKLKKLRQKLDSMVYKVYNDRIEIGTPPEVTTVFINDLRKVKKEYTPEQRKYGLADVLLTTDTRTYRLVGLKQAGALEDVLYIAIKTEEERRKLQEKAKGDHELDPGGLDQMNYLTGLWQQGMISDEDFEQEQAKFNKRK